MHNAAKAIVLVSMHHNYQQVDRTQALALQIGIGLPQCLSVIIIIVAIQQVIVRLVISLVIFIFHDIHGIAITSTSTRCTQSISGTSQSATAA
jgi:uncharacterized membrane protein